jgi:hypothetical protein
MSGEAWVGIVAVIVTALLAYVTSRQSAKERREQLRYDGNTAYLAALTGIERMIAEVPEVLEFHNIGASDLEAVGLTPKEFAYLVVSFTAGSVWFDTRDQKEKMPLRLRLVAIATTCVQA